MRLRINRNVRSEKITAFLAIPENEVEHQMIQDVYSNLISQLCKHYNKQLQSFSDTKRTPYPKTSYASKQKPKS